MVLLAAMLALQAPPELPSGDTSTPIVVTGIRTTGPKQTILGSRIARPEAADPRDFVSQIASQTGVAGMGPGSGMDPFQGGTRKISIKSCKAKGSKLSLAALCDLAAIQKKVALGDRAGALPAIHRLCERNDITPLDCFFARRFQYEMAETAGSDEDRRIAIEAMIETKTMKRTDALAARRTLVAMALKRGDDQAAIEALEKIAAEFPSDAVSQANLAGLYARNGRHEDSRRQMASAVSAARDGGSVPQQAWLDYLAVSPDRRFN